MVKLIDLTGQRFDKVIVIEKAPSRNRHVYWKCQCDCGNICEISGQSLRNSKIKNHDCGCSKKEQKEKQQKKKQEKENWLVGKKFGKLTVLKNLHKTAKDRSRTWECQCECGNICQASTQALTSGHKQSCGCLKDERIIDITGKKFGKLTVLQIDPSTKGIDTPLKWICKCDCGNIVSINSYNLRNGKTQSCGCGPSSIGEANIRDILNKNNISFISEYTSPSLNKKRFDFALLNQKKEIVRLIEFDGEQHYTDKQGLWNSEETLQDIQNRDKEKNQWAKEHNIPLVRIPYWERDNITLDLILGDKYLVK